MSGHIRLVYFDKGKGAANTIKHIFCIFQGTCFSTRGAPIRHQVKVAGDASSFTITTMHDIGNTFDPLFVSPDLYGVTGLTFAVVDDYVTPQASVGSRGMSVLPGIYS